MNTFFIKILLLTLIPLGFTQNKKLAHPLHLSKCEIVCDSKSKSMQITLHVFIDDIETALQSAGNNKLFLGSEQEEPRAEEKLYAYIKEHLKIKADNKIISYKMVGKETTKDLTALWCYMEVSDFQIPHSLEVFNSLLTETFDDQKNIVQIKFPAKKDGFFIFDNQYQKDTYLVN